MVKSQRRVPKVRNPPLASPGSPNFQKGLKGLKEHLGFIQWVHPHRAGEAPQPPASTSRSREFVPRFREAVEEPAIEPPPPLVTSQPEASESTMSPRLFAC